MGEARVTSRVGGGSTGRGARRAGRLLPSLAVMGLVTVLGGAGSEPGDLRDAGDGGLGGGGVRETRPGLLGA